MVLTLLHLLFLLGLATGQSTMGLVLDLSPFAGGDLPFWDEPLVEAFVLTRAARASEPDSGDPDDEDPEAFIKRVLYRVAKRSSLIFLAGPALSDNPFANFVLVVTTVAASVVVEEVVLGGIRLDSRDEPADPGDPDEPTRRDDSTSPPKDSPDSDEDTDG